MEMKVLKKIEDFGEKIGGAKKDLWKERGLNVEDLDSMTDRESHKFVTKDNIWPKPNYIKLVEGGQDKLVVFIKKKIRDSVSSKIKSTGNEYEDKLTRKKYIELVRKIKFELDNISKISDFTNLFSKIFVTLGYYNKGWTAAGNKYDFITNKLIKAVQIKPYSIAKAKIELDKTNFPYKEEKWRKGISIIKFEDEKTWTITKGCFIIKDGFESQEVAEKYLVEKIKPANNSKSKKVKIVRPQLAHVERTGKDYRNNKDIMPKDFEKSFNFRGVEFGNWTSNDDRQQSLNFAYDCFNDLARILGIPSNSVSLNGELGLAFASRGSGNASAHYEPSKVVINLTKMKGAGCTAHEFGHGFDDFLGRLSGDRTLENPYVSHGINKLTSKLDSEVITAFDKVMDTIINKEKTIEEIKAETKQSLKQVIGVLDNLLNDVLDKLNTEQNSYRKGVRRTASEEELKQSKEYVAEIKNGCSAYDNLDKLNILYKSIKGIMIDEKDREDIKKCIHLAAVYKNPIKSVKATKSKRYTDFIKNAKEIDSTRSSSYWTNYEELFARAFESYIEDKINAEGNKSEYLVYGTHNNLYKEFNPYPEGEERKRINESFDNFFDIIKSKKLF